MTEQSQVSFHSQRVTIPTGQPIQLLGFDLTRIRSMIAEVGVGPSFGTSGAIVIGTLSDLSSIDASVVPPARFPGFPISTNNSAPTIIETHDAVYALFLSFDVVQFPQAYLAIWTEYMPLQRAEITPPVDETVTVTEDEDG